MDVNELSENIKIYRGAWTKSGHSGNGQVSLRIPVYAAPTDEQAADEAFDSISSYFGRMGNLYREASGSAGINATELSDNRAERLAVMTYQEMLDTKVAFGSTGYLIEKFHQLKETLGLDGVVAELNPGGLIPSENVLNSLKLITHHVMPKFK
jgi:alkanesulfonate monooxygenase SsuD/methylene tetrahydromethanopterin reductase-like flavin-dependent oxidoreductase (luciferase family)